MKNFFTKHIIVFSISLLFFLFPFFIYLQGRIRTLPFKVKSYDKGKKAIKNNKERNTERLFKVNSISFYSLPIGQRDDFISWLLNFFHWKTEKALIQGDLLFQEGETTNSKFLLESEKNLMATRLFTKVSIQRSNIYKDKENNPVTDIVVLTRDTFSLFGYIDGSFSGGNQWMVLEGGDENFLGKGYLISFKNYTDFYTKIFSQNFINSRLMGTHWKINESSGIQFNNNGEKEGDFQKVELSYPLYSTKTPWGMKALFQRNNVYERQIKSGEITLIPGTDNQYVYKRNELRYELKAFKSTGQAIKFDTSFGFGVYKSRKNSIEDLNDPEREIFSAIQRQREDYFSILSFHIYENNFAKITNYKSLVLPEYILNGFSIEYQIKPGYGWDQDYIKKPFVWHKISLKYTIILPWTDIMEVNFSAESRFAQVEEFNFSNSMDILYKGDLGYSFRWEKYASFIFKAYMAVLQNEVYLNVFTSGDIFRGYLYNEFQGNRFYRFVVELRTFPIRFWYFAIGFIAFFEEESLGMNEFPSPVRATGGGLRIILPEIKSSIIRIDLSYPLDARDNNYQERFLSIGYYQHF